MVVGTAERTTGITIPTLQELYSSRVRKRAGKITLDPSHPAHSLFELFQVIHANSTHCPVEETSVSCASKQRMHLENKYIFRFFFHTAFVLNYLNG